MKAFREFLAQGMIKEREKDEARARNLIKSAEKRKSVMEKYLPLNEETTVQIIEESYDVIREMLEAKLCKEGYKSYNHEAVIAYLSELGFSQEEVLFVDRLREIRHGTKYYGKNVSIEYAQKVRNFLERIYEKLARLAST
jgi:hypothetical protein